MDGMISRSRSVDGVPTSLCDLGYCDVGLDDNWQACGSYGPDEWTYLSARACPLTLIPITTPAIAPSPARPPASS